MIFWIFAGLEALLQMGIGIGLYAGCSGEVHRERKKSDIVLLVYLALLFALEIYDKKFSIISTSTTLINLVLEAFGLWLWFGGSLAKAVYWSFFANWSMVLLKMPVLIMCGLLRGGRMGAVNNSPGLLSGILKCVTLALLFSGCFYGEGWIGKALAAVFRKRRYLLILCGLGEMILTLCLFRVIWDSFRVSALMLNLLIIVCLYLVLFLVMFWMQYRLAEKENQMYLSREKLLKTDYELLQREQENNRKISHDHKYDLAYLLDCLKEKKWEEGVAYIERKLEAGTRRQRNGVWTGCGCIDFLISTEKEQAEKKDIRFSVNADITKIPIAEYELFTILGNLLDNAFEAAEKCPVQERFVSLSFHMVNGMFILVLENSYLTEPEKKKGRFLSAKQGGKEHGWGIENAKELVEKNEGLMNIVYGDHVFKVQLMIGI